MDNPKPIDRHYDGQAHHMAKAAKSLVNLLNGLDYSTFATVKAAHLTNALHILISEIEDIRRTYPVTRPDGQVVSVTVPGRED